MEGQRAQRAEEGEAAGAGNPDIRVPESLKSEEGLSVRHAEKKKEKDAERREAESADKEDSGEDERTIDPYLGEVGPLIARGNPAEGQDGPKKPELRHVPEGAWLKQNIMAQQYVDDDQYGEYDAGHYDQHLEECLVEDLDFHVQDSVNKALVKALRPFAQTIFNFGVRRFGAGSRNPTPVEVNINEPGQSSYDLLDQTVNTVLSDHE
ncbi:hypothetical protein NDU88_002967 [Pleurodeles waltl]|uniref:Uncharacterized protein n=1 Tax=Pleurodeles waltl TaxID=8319 RepID=A0AAV7NFG8_PLEWA|nr:hypothetical protein NDU88_002967 [Pleurodeles waltl]